MEKTYRGDVVFEAWLETPGLATVSNEAPPRSVIALK